MIPPSSRLLFGCLALLGGSVLPSPAAVTWLQADLDGAQVPTDSVGTGKALVSYNDVTGQLTWTVSWNDIFATPTDLHFHGPAAPGATAGVQVGIGVASNPISGTATITPVQAADLLNGLWYINLHTSDYPDGEIRGQVLRSLTNYWSLEEGTGTTSANAVPAAAPAGLNGGVNWTDDPTRGNVLSFDGAAGSYVDAGTIGPIAVPQDFTWAFWSWQDPAQLLNNDIIIGNRQPDAGWAKFTPNAFELRDITPTFDNLVDYPNFANGVWVHNAVVKSGAEYLYYRNGIQTNRAIAVGTLPELTPLYFGGDAVATGEGWQGQLDDVATWRSALPMRSVLGLAGGTLLPSTAPIIPANPVLNTLLSDDFSGDLSKWTVTNLGLENNSPAGYDAPVIDVPGGFVTLGGTTTQQYWFGSSLESVATFDSRIETAVSVKRVFLDRTGTAGRSSLWIYGDSTHYLHFSQNLGENGWQFNARDDGGIGGLNATGGGNNLASLDPLDNDNGEHTMALRLVPGLVERSLNIEILLDGQVVTTHGFTNFPNAFKVVLTGQARAIGDFVGAQFDDLLVTRIPVINLPPVFSATSITLSSATEGVAYSASLAGQATDPEAGALTFSADPATLPGWLTLASNGTISGNPGAGETGVVSGVRVTVTDPGGLTSETTVGFRVQKAAAPPLTYYGWWPLNDGSGTFVRSVSGEAAAGTLSNDTTGGLGQDGAAWVTDPVYGSVLSFNGAENTGAWVVIGSPPDSGNLSNTVLTGDFTLTCRLKANGAANNDIVIGNRFDAAGAEFVPRQFVKLTQSAFEWHWNGAGQNADFADIAQGTWMHITVVKDGNSLTSYRDGIPTATATLTGAPDIDLPLFFGGQGTVENWNGYLSDVRFFTTALKESQIATIAADTNLPASLKFDISSVSMDAARRVTLTWPVSTGFTYAVWASTDLDNWVEVVDSLTTGTYTVQPGGIPDTALENRIFYQIRAASVP